MNVLELYRNDGFEPRKASPREWQGPCPSCEGTDRFCIYPGQGSEKAPALGTFHCGHGKMGEGCNLGGDAIAYLQIFHDMDFKGACRELGIETGRPPASRKYRTPVKPKQHGGPILQPVTWGWPEDLRDPARWQEKAFAFVEYCHEKLLNNPVSIAYLAQRGIDLDAIIKFKLGYHFGNNRDDNRLQPIFRELSSWGLAPVKRSDGRPGVIMIPAGIVIPWFEGEEKTQSSLRRIRVRLAIKDKLNPKKKYHNLRGSCMGLWHTRPQCDVQTIVETDLDAVMLDTLAGDLTGVVSLGSVSMQPDSVVHPILQRAHTIINALDNDSAAIKPSKNWALWYQQCKRWPVPVGKDPGEAFEQGLDIRAWIKSALPPGLQSLETEDDHEPVKSDDTPESADELEGGGRGKKEVKEGGAGEGGFEAELREFCALMQKHQAALVIKSHGAGVGIWYPSERGLGGRDDRLRLNELLYSGEVVPQMVPLMGAGSWQYPQLIKFFGL